MYMYVREPSPHDYLSNRDIQHDDPRVLSRSNFNPLEPRRRHLAPYIILYPLKIKKQDGPRSPAPP
jgi:hypothetical protein